MNGGSRRRMDPDPMRQEMRKFLSILAISLLASACSTATSSGGPGATTTPGASTTPGTSNPPTRHYSVETAPDKQTLRLSVEGGFVAPGYLLTAVPQFAVFGDGRVITPGPVDAKYPGPLLPNLRQMRVTADEIQEIVAAADAAGLLGPNASYDATNVADAGTAVFTTTVDGKTHVISAYALFEGATTDNQATAAVRARLLDFQGKILDLPKFLGRSISNADAYVPTAMRVFARPASTTDQSGITPQVVNWPLTRDPMTAGQPTTNSDARCIAIDGADLTAFLAIARTANSITVWIASSGRLNISVRPLYPNESGCATAG
jgi:hypothetical protein